MGFTLILVHKNIMDRYTKKYIICDANAPIIPNKSILCCNMGENVRYYIPFALKISLVWNLVNSIFSICDAVRYAIYSIYFLHTFNGFHFNLWLFQDTSLLFDFLMLTDWHWLSHVYKRVLVRNYCATTNWKL